MMMLKNLPTKMVSKFFQKKLFIIYLIFTHKFFNVKIL